MAKKDEKYTDLWGRTIDGNLDIISDPDPNRNNSTVKKWDVLLVDRRGNTIFDIRKAKQDKARDEAKKFVAIQPLRFTGSYYDYFKYYQGYVDNTNLPNTFDDYKKIVAEKLQQTKDELIKKYSRFPSDEQLKSMPYPQYSNVTQVMNRKEKNIFKKLGNLLKNVALAPAMVALTPFKGAMKKKLAEKNISHKNKISDIATKFYHNVVNKYDYEGYEEFYHADENKDKKGSLVGTIGGIIGGIAGTFAAPGAGTAAGAAGGKIAFEKLIPIILDFFAMLFNKKANKKASQKELELLTIVEEDIEKVEKNPKLINEEIKKELEPTGSTFSSNPIFIVIIIIVGFFLIKKFYGKS